MKKKFTCGFCGSSNDIESGTYTVPKNTNAFSIVKLQEQITELKAGITTKVKKPDQVPVPYKESPVPVPDPEKKLKNEVKNAEENGSFGDWL